MTAGTGSSVGYLQSRHHLVLALTVVQLCLLSLASTPWALHGGNVVLALLLAWALRQITGEPRDFWILLVPGLFAPFLDIMIPWASAPLGVNLLKEACWLFAPAYLAQRMFVTIYRADAITHEEISGAISVYLLVGFLFANVYELLVLFDPVAIQWGANFIVEARSFADFVYFSFVTMAGVGYGDVAPASQLTRATVVAQAIAGLMYIAVLIARFVGEHQRRRSD